MTALSSVSVFRQNVLCFWALIVCLLALLDVILLWRQKRRGLAALALLPVFAGYFLLQVLRAQTESRLNGVTTPLAVRLAECPAVGFAGALLLLTGAALLLYRYIRRWRKSHITLASIKESFDGLPAGLCFYLEGGRCILVNHRMQDICRALSGQTLQNGAAFYETVKATPVTLLPDGTAVSFRHRLLTYDGAPLFELIADDVTELYAQSEQLRQDNERARRLSREMKAYSLTLDDTVRRQEILQARIAIHDGMNRLILTAQNAASGTEEERAAILQDWQNQALLLGRESVPPQQNSLAADIKTLGKSIGMEITWLGEPETEDRTALTLLLMACREAIANAAKHAGAKHLIIRITNDDDVLTACFTNDGKQPQGEVRAAGGLLNLKAELLQYGGTLQLESMPEFRLTVTIPPAERRAGCPIRF